MDSRPSFRLTLAGATLAAVAASAAPASQAAAQQAPRSLPAPNASFDEPFSAVGIGAVRELRDGRVIVADPRDKVVSLVDLRSGESRGIGREGSGPQEYGFPSRLFTAPGDTTLLFDPLNSRYLVIGPTGAPLTTFRIETEPARPAGGQGGPVMMMPGLMARASDARGRLYAEGAPFSQGPNGQPVSADSVPLLRYDRGTRRLDTLAYVKVQASSVQTSGGQGNMRVMIGGANPLAPRDEWTVFPDGRVAIVRAADYHVDFIMPDGTKRAAPRIAYTPIRMSAAEIRYEEGLRAIARANQMSVMVNNNNGNVQRSATLGPPPGAPPLEPLTNWPEVKPPFRPGQASVVARPNGELWVRRTENAQARGTLYDVINAQGAVAYQVRLAEGVTLVGFGNGTVYTTRKDEDDLLYLQRHAF